jgi:hypothetical protein
MSNFEIARMLFRLIVFFYRNFAVKQAELSDEKTSKIGPDAKYFLATTQAQNQGPML